MNNKKIKGINMVIRVTEAQKNLYEKAADCQSKFLSEWVREVLEKEAKLILKKENKITE